MIDKIIEVLQEAVHNIYFIYAVIAITIFVIIKNAIKYKSYLSDCKALNMEPKLGGYIINAGMDILLLSMVTHIAFVGYTAYLHTEIINIEKNEKVVIKKKTEPINYKLKNVITQNQKTIYNKPFNLNKNVNPIQQRRKPKNEKFTAKEKLKRELEAAINTVEK